MLQIFAGPLPALGVGGVLAAGGLVDLPRCRVMGARGLARHRRRDLARRCAGRRRPRRAASASVRRTERCRRGRRPDTAPSRISILRHLVSRPTGIASDSAKGLLPSLVLIEDGDGALTRVRLLPSPAFVGMELHTDAGIDGDHPVRATPRAD